MIFKSKDFFKEEIWLIPEHRLDRFQAFGLKALRVTLLSVFGFIKDLCPLRAAALTLYTLLSIVPIIALLFGIAKGFGVETTLRERILEQNPQQQDLLLQIMGFAENMLANTKGGLVAGIGIVVLLWTVIKVLGNIEESFNHIWKIEKNRSVTRKVTDYLSIMMLAPVLLITSGSITVFIKTQLTWLIEVMHLPALATQLVLHALNLSSLLLMGLLFSFIFVFMPNRKIDLKSGFVAGMITAVLYQIVQWIYLSLQIGASSYNAIYGSFAALPLFIVWLQLGWSIVLLGCEMTFYIQNYQGYCHNERYADLSLFLKKTIALLVMHTIVEQFVKGDRSSTLDNICQRLSLPLSVVQQTLRSLLASGLLVEIGGDEEKEAFYQPAYDINRMTVAQVVDQLETAGNNRMPDSDKLETFASLVKNGFSYQDKSFSTTLLKDI